MFCKNCGKEIDDKAAICIHCGVAVENAASSKDSSWGVALLLCFFLGGFGAHRFYTGHIASAVVQMVLTFTLIGAVISGPWILVDLISIICGKFKTADGKMLTR